MRDNEASSDHYAVLGILRSATSAEIQRAYLHLARKHHPDLQLAAERAAAVERFAAIAEARRVLADPTLRGRYDARDTSAPMRELAAHLVGRRPIVNPGARS